MITIQLSDKMAQRLWRKLQYKQNEVWVYLRKQLFEATGFPQAVRELKREEVLKTRPVIEIQATGLVNRLHIALTFLVTGKFKILYRDFRRKLLEAIKERR